MADLSQDSMFLISAHYIFTEQINVMIKIEEDVTGTPEETITWGDYDGCF